MVLFCGFFCGRDSWKLDELGREIVSIALPVVLALAADPITSLVDSAFVGHLGMIIDVHHFHLLEIGVKKVRAQVHVSSHLVLLLCFDNVMVFYSISLRKWIMDSLL